MFCKKCGKELHDEAVVCPQCGCLTDEGVIIKRKDDSPKVDARKEEQKGMATAIKVLMIICCVLSGFWLIPLCWTIPMTVVLCKKLEKQEKISVGLKICTLLFCSLIAGVLLLCIDEE